MTSGRSKISLTGRAPTLEFGTKTQYLVRFLPKTSMEMKEIGPGGVTFLASPWINSTQINHICISAIANNFYCPTTNLLKLKILKTKIKYPFHLACLKVKKIWSKNDFKPKR